MVDTNMSGNISFFIVGRERGIHGGRGRDPWWKGGRDPCMHGGREKGIHFAQSCAPYHALFGKGPGDKVHMKLLLDNETKRTSYHL